MSFLALLVIVALIQVLLWSFVRGACARETPEVPERKSGGVK